MLAIPTRGFSLSVNTHNVALDVLCDWMEASVLFVEDRLSMTDFVDTLCSEHIYRDQTFANALVADGWSEIRRRVAWLGNGAPLQIQGSKLCRTRDWEKSSAYSFCLMLSLRKWFKKWATQFGANFNVQGSLFEELTKESLSTLLPGWEVHQTGWTTKTPNRLHKVVRKVATQLSEPEGEVLRWTKPTANEAGLDLVCYRPFADGRVGLPVYLFQCASGGDWDGKLHTPDLRIWGRIVNFTADPKKAFASPFAFLDADYTMNCNLVNGLLLDRFRLLSPLASGQTWPTASLTARINGWLKPRVKKLPTL